MFCYYFSCYYLIHENSHQSNYVIFIYVFIKSCGLSYIMLKPGFKKCFEVDIRKMEESVTVISYLV